MCLYSNGAEWGTAEMRKQMRSMTCKFSEVTYGVTTGAAFASNSEAEQIVLAHPTRFLEALRAGREASRKSFNALLETIVTRPEKVAKTGVSCSDYGHNSDSFLLLDAPHVRRLVSVCPLGIAARMCGFTAETSVFAPY